MRTENATFLAKLGKDLMRSTAVFALVLLPAMTGQFAGIAQENVTIDGVEAQRVIIAPPQSELALTIKNGLFDAYESAAFGSTAFADAQKLYYFYGSRHFEPLWLAQDESGEISFSAKAQSILKVFENADMEGLRPEDYLTDALSLDADFSSPDRIAALETAFSASAVKYAQDAYGGRINPRSVSGYISLTPPQLNGAEFLLELAAADEPDQMLLDLSPDNREFLGLKALLARHINGTIEEGITIPAGELLKPGMNDNRVPLLRERLELPALDGSLLYDEVLVAAVESFQEEQGLLVDGVIGPATVAAFNGGANISKEDIIANMERWRWLPRDLGEFHVFVNIPEFRLYIYDQGREHFTTRVVVGKRSNQTPVFSDEIEHVVMNPYWNVPSSIAREEIAPLLVSNPGYLSARNMELLSGGSVVNASAIDWSTTSINNFRIRQRPGSSNALGQVKFLFPNSHSVYLHDTPSRSLFSRSTRAFSHGCVRVQNPMDFAQALLANEPTLTRASLEAQRGPSERWNNLDVHVPVHLSYFTLRVDQNGHVQSYGDIYGHNEKLKSLLGF